MAAAVALPGAGVAYVGVSVEAVETAADTVVHVARTGKAVVEEAADAAAGSVENLG